MDFKDKVKTLLKGRRIIDSSLDEKKKIRDKYSKEEYLKSREEVGNVVKKVDEELKKLGFNSVKDFIDFNKQIKVECISAYLPSVRGSCDKCEGLLEEECKKIGLVNDNNINSQNICFYNPPKSMLDVKNWRDIAADSAFNVSKLRNCSDGTIRIVCPDGHGYYWLNDDFKDLPFDLNWSLEK